MILPGLVLPDDTMKEWVTRRELIRNRIEEFQGEICQVPVDLDVQTLGEEDCGSYVRRKISYLVAEGDRTFAYLLLPKEIDQPAPAVICFHGTNVRGKDIMITEFPETKDRNYAEKLAERGYVCLAPDFFCAGERLAEGELPYDKNPFFERFPEWSAHGKGAYDGARDIDFLLTLSEVDSKRIATIGHSLGGDRAIHTAIYDERVTTVVCSCGLWPHFGYHKRAMHATGYIKGWENKNPLANLRFREYARELKEYPYEVHEIYAMIAPRPLLLTYGFTDSNTNNLVMNHEVMEHVHKLYKFLGKEHHFAHLFHGDGHDSLPWVQDMMYGFLDRFLDNENFG